MLRIKKSYLQFKLVFFLYQNEIYNFAMYVFVLLYSPFAPQYAYYVQNIS